MIPAACVSPFAPSGYIAAMDGRDAQPRILIADDDAVSLRFLAAALRELGATVTEVASGTATLAACTGVQFDLLLLDRRMPDCGGTALLHALRDRGIATSAIATSAELDAATRAELAAAGYIDALTKPIGLDALARALATHLSGWRDPRARRSASIRATSQSNASVAEVLDDAAGLASVDGDRATLLALRSLLAGELEALSGRLAATPNPSDLADILHRLRASCRYCGATALGEASLQLESAIRTNDANVESPFQQFAAACAHTLAALSAPSS